MALFSTKNVDLRGVSAAVPLNIEHNKNYALLSDKEVKLLIKTTGVESKHKAPAGTTSSDYCLAAAQKLLLDLGWKPSEVELLIFVSQSPDYFLPSTATVLQHKLGLPESAIAYNIGLGCSGFVYGMSLVTTMMQSGFVSKGLLLCGDVSTTSVSYHDKSTYPLFGDAGTAAAFEFKDGASEISFNLQTDGKGFEAIIIPDGGCRNPLKSESEVMLEVEVGVTRRKKDLWLNGMDVFNFSVTKVPANIRQLLSHCKVDVSDPDFFIMHQANLLMNETIRRGLNIDASKTPYSLKDYGNTSSASIPLTMVTQIAEQLRMRENTLLLAGFGVGLSWGSVLLKTDSIIISDLVEM